MFITKIISILLIYFKKTFSTEEKLLGVVVDNQLNQIFISKILIGLENICDQGFSICLLVYPCTHTSLFRRIYISNVVTINVRKTKDHTYYYLFAVGINQFNLM